MKSTISITVLLLVFCTFYAQAQDKIIRSKYGLNIYPEKKPANYISVYPNPATTFVSFKAAKPLGGFNLEVFDKAGISCEKREQWSGEKFNVSQWEAGIYILRFTKGKEQYWQKLVVVK